MFQSVALPHSLWSHPSNFFFPLSNGSLRAVQGKIDAWTVGTMSARLGTNKFVTGTSCRSTSRCFLADDAMLQTKFVRADPTCCFLFLFLRDGSVASETATVTQKHPCCPAPHRLQVQVHRHNEGRDRLAFCVHTRQASRATEALVMLGGAECGSSLHQPSKAGLPVPERAGMRFSGHDVYVPNKYEKCLSVVRLRLSSADNGKIFCRCRYNIPLSV